MLDSRNYHLADNFSQFLSAIEDINFWKESNAPGTEMVTMYEKTLRIVYLYGRNAGWTDEKLVSLQLIIETLNFKEVEGFTAFETSKTSAWK